MGGLSRAYPYSAQSQFCLSYSFSPWAFFPCLSHVPITSIVSGLPFQPLPWSLACLFFGVPSPASPTVSSVGLIPPSPSPWSAPPLHESSRQNERRHSLGIKLSFEFISIYVSFPYRTDTLPLRSLP
ncbi:hypothetical protein E2C01_003304 [Portunus trituberculatus]|uniref:Uncharacterized protein n=1 Tax=Portunus trituberculatus TaxID=210409 RepID=A0A5B7CND0_PORTR|nr:hypothetical protein [Portunus trituberculatus]